MAERIIHLSIKHLFDENHNHPDIPRFINDFSGSLYSGDGKRPVMLDRLGIGPDFPVRLLVGVAQRTMTREQRLIAEAACSLFFDRPLGDTKRIWSYGAGWRPTNPNQKPAPLNDCRLDVNYMLSLGISKATWCNDILMAPTAFDTKTDPRPATLMRYLFSLVAFGFYDPNQFFTANHHD